jgi:heme/copper-type cytochrome/quinol oxidase subunit 2
MNETRERTWILPLFAAAALLFLRVQSELSAQPIPTGDTAAIREADNATAPTAPEKQEQAARRRVMRRVAATSLLIILILIIFVVIVMISTRRMRIRYLGWDRSIKFNKIWDIWWQKPEEGKPPGKDKPAAK